MAGGITPVIQPINKFIVKVFKFHYQEKYSYYILTDSENEKGQPIPPIRQLFPKWVVMTWSNVSEKYHRGVGMLWL